MRAKFVLSDRHQSAYNQGEKLVFSAVKADGIPENDSFNKYTPQGKLEMYVDNPVVLEKLVLGKSYYLDFTQAD